MPVITYCFDKVFWPPREGCHFLSNMHVQYLAGSGLTFRVVLIVQPHEEDLVADFCRHFSHVHIRTFRVSDLGEGLTSRYMGLKKEHTFHSMLEANSVAVKHAGFQEELAHADILFTNYVYSAPFLSYIPPRCVSIVETHDIQASQQTCLMQNPALTPGNDKTPEGEALYRKLLHEEIALLDLFDSVVAIAGDEAEIMARHLPAGKVTYVPPVLIPRSPRPKQSVPQYDLLFVGGHHPPNVRSIQEFYEDTFVPFLRPLGIRLALVGKVGALSGIEDESVMRLGFMEDLRKAYEFARVVICPIFYGAGCNIKVVEALTYGKAIVASPHALRGLNVDSSQLRVASDPETFARHITTLLNDPALLKVYEERSLKVIRTGHAIARYERLWGGIMSRALRQFDARVSSPQAAR